MKHLALEAIKHQQNASWKKKQKDKKIVKERRKLKKKTHQTNRRTQINEAYKHILMLQVLKLGIIISKFHRETSYDEGSETMSRSSFDHSNY